MLQVGTGIKFSVSVMVRVSVRVGGRDWYLIMFTVRIGIWVGVEV